MSDHLQSNAVDRNKTFTTPTTPSQKHSAGFSRPDIPHHICSICQSIPLELFLIGSKFVSGRCRGNHPHGQACKGGHQIACARCHKDTTEIHYNCDTCTGEPFDVCVSCLDQPGSNHDSAHNLRKRVLKDGIIIHADEDKVCQMVKQWYKDQTADKASTISITTDDDACRKFFEVVAEPYLLHPNADSLTKSASSGCHICSLVAKRLPLENRTVSDDAAIYLVAHVLPPPLYHVKDTKFWQSFRDDPDLDLDGDWQLPYLMIGYGTDIKNLGWYGPLTYEVSGSQGRFFSREIDWIKNRRFGQISPYAGDEKSLKAVSEWIDECLQTHEDCVTFSEPSFVPSRLVDVGGDESPIRLVQRSSILPGDSHEYLALSYCWGETEGKQSWTTTEENLSSFKVEIPTSMIPKTILDAIHTVRAVGYRYLWVDSLCIVQDDTDDWSHEVRSMADIYTNSVCTLISGTDSVQGGLFQPRSQLEVSAAETMASSASGYCQPQRVTLFPQIADKSTFGRPTSTRAWCMQEELLSRRRLHFTEDQFIFKCQKKTCFETGVRRPGDTVKVEEGFTFPPYSIDLVYYPAKVIGEWGRIINEFTSRALRFESDVFPAIGGLALQMAQKHESQYLAGLWDDDIAASLLWQRAGDTVEKPSSYTAPSWSWLSVKGTVIFERGSGDSITEEVELISHEIETIDGCPYSQTLSGKLVLKAQMVHSFIDSAKPGDGKGMELLKNLFEIMEGYHARFKNDRARSQTGSVSDEVAGEREKSTATAHDDENEGETNTTQAAEDQGGQKEDTKSSQEEEAREYVLRTGPFEIYDQFSDESWGFRLPGNRLDMIAAISASIPGRDGRYQFGTVFFDGESESKLSEVYVVHLATRDREDVVQDRNGIAVTKVSSGNGELDTYRRVGFVGFWDKFLEEDKHALDYLTKGDKTEFVLI